MLYHNLDLETTGTDPSRHAILSIGIVAIDSETLQEAWRKQWNLRVPEGRTWDADTVDFWIQNPEAFRLSTEDARDVKSVLRDVTAYVNPEYEHAFVCNPLAFDLPFFAEYVRRYSPYECRYGLSLIRGVDLPTLAMLALGKDRMRAGRSAWPEDWTSGDHGVPHTALADASRQAQALVSILRGQRELADFLAQQTCSP